MEQAVKAVLADMRSQRRGVEEFRNRHELGERQADYAERSREAMWVGAIAVVEIVLNAVPLGEVMPYGIAGVLGVVCFITAIKVAFGYVIAGPWWRGRNHVEAWKGRNATAGCVGIGIGIVAFNVGVGQFRDAMEAFGARPPMGLGDLRFGVMVEAAPRGGTARPPADLLRCVSPDRDAGAE